MRARNIKPDFFRDAELAEVTVETRYLFIGLWCLADRGGKLKDQPKQIRFEVFPETKTKDDIETMLKLLVEHNLIIRYVVDNKRFIKVTNFLKHQSPHTTEKKSEMPEPNVSSREATLSNVNIPLNPDCGILNPDSLNPDLNTPPTPPKGESRSRKSKKPGTPLPENFGISEAVLAWATGKGFTRLEEHLESFKDYALSRGKTYADWDAAFRRAIKENWAKVGGNGQFNKTPLKPGESHGNNLAAETDKYSTRAGRKIVDLDSP